MRGFWFSPVLTAGFRDGREGRSRDRGAAQGILFSVLLMCVGLAAKAQKPSASAPAPVGALLDVGGYRVHVYCAGSGSPTVMIVGAAFSFDWDLVQSAVAKFTRVCTFDPSGTAWSDSFESADRALNPNATPRSTPTCADRVAEIDRVMTHASVEGPTILVGYSVGALWERLYAARHSEGIAGMVIVDHAFLPESKETGTRKADAPKSSKGVSAPVLLTQAPIVIGFEDDVNFWKLPQRDRELHRWAMAQHPVRPDEAMAADCFSQIGRADGDRRDLFGDLPLTVIRTENRSPGYAEMQRKLLGLSRQSRQVVAWNSSHMVPIDEPDVIVAAIRAMADAVRGR
jgi:pimeloyl-ACP methyl ester carboxylesterase